MISAYSKLYLEDAMKNLGEAFDYACYSENMTPNQFITIFISSGVSSLFERGNVKYINMPGMEIVFAVFERSGKKIIKKKREICEQLTREYWCGWITAYYQWYSGKSFEYIQRFLPAEEILKLYNPLHEAHERKFLEIADSIISSRDTNSRLKELRSLSGLTQKELSTVSGVNIRTIQQYENMSKDIKKARGDILLSLSRALDTSIEALLE